MGSILSPLLRFHLGSLGFDLVAEQRCWQELGDLQGWGRGRGRDGDARQIRHLLGLLAVIAEGGGEFGEGVGGAQRR